MDLKLHEDLSNFFLVMETQWQIVCSGAIKTQAETEELLEIFISVLINFIYMLFVLKLAGSQ